MIISFSMDNISKILGFRKIEMRSWKSSWIKFRNNKTPRITRMYSEKSCPADGNIIPNIVEIRIDIARTIKTLVLYVVNEIIRYHIIINLYQYIFSNIKLRTENFLIFNNNVFEYPIV